MLHFCQFATRVGMQSVPSNVFTPTIDRGERDLCIRQRCAASGKLRLQEGRGFLSSFNPRDRLRKFERPRNCRAYPRVRKLSRPTLGDSDEYITRVLRNDFLYFLFSRLESEFFNPTRFAFFFSRSDLPRYFATRYSNAARFYGALQFFRPFPTVFFLFFFFFHSPELDLKFTKRQSVSQLTADLTRSLRVRPNFTRYDTIFDSLLRLKILLVN